MNACVGFGYKVDSRTVTNRRHYIAIVRPGSANSTHLRRLPKSLRS